MNFTEWLDTFIEEKEIDTDFIFEVQTASNLHFIEFDALVEFIKAVDTSIQAFIKDTIVKIDLANGDVMHFFKHMAEGMALAYES